MMYFVVRMPVVLTTNYNKSKDWDTGQVANSLDVECDSPFVRAWTHTIQQQQLVGKGIGNTGPQEYLGRLHVHQRFLPDGDPPPKV